MRDFRSWEPPATDRTENSRSSVDLALCIGKGGTKLAVRHKGVNDNELGDSSGVLETPVQSDRLADSDRMAGHVGRHRLRGSGDLKGPRKAPPGPIGAAESGPRPFGRASRL